MIEPSVDGLRGDGIAVVNVGQETLDGCHKHAEQRDERADAAEEETKRLWPTRHDVDTRVTGNAGVWCMNWERRLTKLDARLAASLR